MKYLLATTSIFTMLFISSCGGEAEETTETENTDSTAVTEEIIEGEQTEIAFDGTDAGEYLLYGHTEITADEAVSVEEMMTQFNEAGSFSDKVSVSIDQVCQKAGCWITFKNTEDEEIRVFFRDHFTIPIETASGTDAILYGDLVMDTLSVDFQKHLLDDAKEAGEEVAQEEYDAITEDKIEASFDCESILVKK
jgi:hypothetical protein